MLTTGPSFSFQADSSTIIAFQSLVLLTLLISQIIFHQQKKNFDNKIGKKISRFFIANLALQFFTTIILVNNLLTGASSLNFFYPVIPFLINISLCAFVWVWCFPDASLRNDLPLAIYIFFTFILIILEFSFRALIQVSNLDISFLLLSLQSFISILFILTGLLIILFKHKDNWLAGFLVSFVSIIGLSIIFFNPSLSANLSSLLFFELTAYLFLPFLPGSLTDNIRPNQKLAQPINEEMLVAWLKLIQIQNEKVIASDFLSALRLTFSADQVILVGSSKINQVPGIIAITGLEPKKSHLQKIEASFSLFESWFKEEKKGVILKSGDAFPAEVDSFLKTAGIEKPINFLFYLTISSTKSDNKFALIFLSKEFYWNEQYVHWLETGKRELFKVLQNLVVGKNSENGTQKDLLGVKEISSLIHQTENFTGRIKESDAKKISRLESELKLALEEYDRVLKLLEENMKKSSANWK